LNDSNIIPEQQNISLYNSHTYKPKNKHNSYKITVWTEYDQVRQNEWYQSEISFDGIVYFRLPQRNGFGKYFIIIVAMNLSQVIVCYSSWQLSAVQFGESEHLW